MAGTVNSRIEFEDEISDAEWSDLIQSSTSSTPFHMKSWIDVWSKTFGYRARYLLARETNGEISAGMPIMESRSKSKVSYESMPWGCYGGVVVRTGTSAEVVNGLVDEYCLIASHEKVQRAIVVDFSGTMSAMSSRSTNIHEYFALALDIGRPFHDVYTGYDHSIKKNLRTAERHSVLVRDVENEEELEEYWAMSNVIAMKYARKPYPRDLFLNIYRIMVPRREAKFTMAFLGDIALAGALHIVSKGHVFNWLTVSYPETLNYRPVEAVDSHVIKWACDSEFKLYNFGGSPANAHGLIRFKEKWGTKRMCYKVFEIESKVLSPPQKSFAVRCIQGIKHVVGLLGMLNHSNGEKRHHGPNS